MSATLLHIHPENPQPRQIAEAVDVLRRGGVIIYPTDTIYGLGCSILQPKAIERICLIKGIKPEKAHFSFICADLSHISDYTRPIDTPTFKMMRRALPGPFTFILNASNEVPRLLQTKKRTVGIRVPDHAIAQALVAELGHPILSTSLHAQDEILQYPTDPELIHEEYESRVDLVIEGGMGELIASTVVDCTGDEVVILREGAGDLSLLD